MRCGGRGATACLPLLVTNTRSRDEAAHPHQAGEQCHARGLISEVALTQITKDKPETQKTHENNAETSSALNREGGEHMESTKTRKQSKKEGERELVIR